MTTIWALYDFFFLCIFLIKDFCWTVSLSYCYLWRTGSHDLDSINYEMIASIFCHCNHFTFSFFSVWHRKISIAFFFGKLAVNYLLISYQIKLINSWLCCCLFGGLSSWHWPSFHHTQFRNYKAEGCLPVTNLKQINSKKTLVELSNVHISPCLISRLTVIFLWIQVVVVLAKQWLHKYFNAIWGVCVFMPSMKTCGLDYWWSKSICPTVCRLIGCSSCESSLRTTVWILLQVHCSALLVHWQQLIWHSKVAKGDTRKYTYPVFFFFGAC